ncbi:MAG: ATP-binding protein [Candidatus Beckwithbacteria bacterium]
MFPRSILPKLEKELKAKEIVVLTGMRQVGKTTLLKYLFDQISSTNKVFLDLQNPINRKIFEEENYDTIWENLAPFQVKKSQPSYIFLDEIQNSKNISQVVKYLFDHYQVKFFLTGSSSFYLKNLFSESLSGRKVIYELYPLSFQEFLIFKKHTPQPSQSFSKKSSNKNQISYHQKIKLYQEYMEFGGFPRVVLEKNSDRKKILLDQIFTSYFEIDVQKLADFKQLSKLRDLILILIPRVGSKLDITKISSELHLSRETIYNYLQFLHHTYFIRLVNKFSNSIDRQAAGNKKVFLCDSGLANRLGRLSQGQLFEQSVFQSLKPYHQLNYYTKGGQEIDFIIDKKIAIEVKFTASKKHLADLKKRGQSLKIKEKYIISYNYSPLPNVILSTNL